VGSAGDNIPLDEVLLCALTYLILLCEAQITTVQLLTMDGVDMKLRYLCKSNESRTQNDCPAMYIAEDPAVMVGQGKLLDPATAAELRHVAADEAGVAIPTETVLRSAALVLAEHGRPAMLDEVEAFLSDQAGGSR
jgi:hypothetical protein